MEKKFFVLHLLPCRPTFAFDMNDEERGIMQQHIVYWKELMNKGKVIVYGPVMDPKGPYGLGVVTVSGVDELNSLIANDPANGLNRYESFPMMAVIKE